MEAAQLSACARNWFPVGACGRGLGQVQDFQVDERQVNCAVCGDLIRGQPFADRTGRLVHMGCRTPHDEACERRCDPELGGRDVTFQEMCDAYQQQQGLTDLQMQLHWSNLQVAATRAPPRWEVCNEIRQQPWPFDASPSIAPAERPNSTTPMEWLRGNSMEAAPLLCACGHDLAACGACGRGWAQVDVFRLDEGQPCADRM